LQSASATASGVVPTQSTPTLSHSTAVPSPSLPADSPVPTQAGLPPKQTWCPSEIFCAGELLQEVNIVKLYPDDKTFVDKPTNRASQEVLAAFKNITANNATTVGQIQEFVNTNFRGEGLELEALTLDNFEPNPAFLKNVTDPLVKSWVRTVHGYWTQLIRGTEDSQACGANSTCESSLIPLNHTFVVPGGRFREQYYWDSYWIVEGLIQSELHDVAKDTLQNFMDELEHIGFIPNGGRIYYLNRSQPPLFIRMLSRYVEATNDTSILERALPLAEKELKWWADNRSVQVKSSFTNKTHTMFRYSVTNSAPRPESYLTDYNTAHDSSLEALNETAISNLYAELATGAESGWDYTSRWLSNVQAGNVGLRSLHVRSIVPVDLNAILYDAHIKVADLYSQGNSSNKSNGEKYRKAASALKVGIIDVLWDASRFAFYDYNHVTNTRSTIFSAANFYPYWLGVVPDEVTKSKENAFKAFSSVNMVMSRYNGTFPATFVETGLQWDAPNAWPPHQHIILEALRALPANVSSGDIPMPAKGQSTFSLIPAGQLGLEENQLFGQPVRISGGNGAEPNATLTGSGADINAINGTVSNGGNTTEGEGWRDRLERELANRYITSAFCSWRATGGEIPGVLPKLSPQELNVTDSVNNTGNMFEKFSVVDIDSAGRGGEYTVQAGFGWTNGAVLLLAHLYGHVLTAPTCPNILDTQIAQAANSALSFNANVFMAAVFCLFVALFGL